MTVIKLERRYPHPPARVWRALTDRAALSEWLMKTDDFEPKVGARFVLRAKPQPGWRGFVECEVTECVEGKTLAYTWQGDEKGPPMKVRFELSPCPVIGTGAKTLYGARGPKGLARESRSAIRSETSADGAGTKLSFEHAGFRGIGGWMLARFMMGPGWKKMMDQRLPAVMDRAARASGGGEPVTTGT